MRKLCDKNTCTGCGGCVSICPKNAISLSQEDNGFLYPKINEEKCINCGMCEKFTTILKNKKTNNTNEKKAYACKQKNDKLRMQSQSGGLFATLANYILDENGVVYGCAYSDNFKVEHIKIEKKKDLIKLKGSKYVQSYITHCFKSIIDDLKSDRIVLFSGTPCQVDAIIKYAKIKNISTDNLYSCDLICHGVPSPKVYEDYLRFMEEKYNSKIKNINLRDKKNGGWHNHVDSIEFENGEKYCGKIYVDLFYSNLTLRKSCETCNYTNLERVSDITIADCWGIEKIYPNLWNDNKGISLAIIQTEKGLKLFDKISKELDIQELKIEDCMQPQLSHPTKKPYKKEKFWKDYNKNNFEYILKKYTPYGGIKFKIKRKILKVINKW